MKGFYLPKYNIAIQMIDKSGSLLILNSFKLFFENNNVIYEDILPKKNYFKLKTKFYFFVRNPLDRFKTCYNWFEQSSYIKDLKSLKDKFQIVDINSFIKCYLDLIIEVDNGHFEPQIFSILNLTKKEKNNSISNYSLKDIIKSLKEKYFDFEFLKIEDIETKLDSFISLFGMLHGTNEEYDYNNDKLEFFIDTIDELKNEFTLIQKINSNAYYSMFRLYLDKSHHKKANTLFNSLDMNLLLFDKNLLLFGIEAELFGYSKIPIKSKEEIVKLI